jgi:hypothetical protein
MTAGKMSFVCLLIAHVAFGQPAPADAPALPRESAVENPLSGASAHGSAFGGYGEITLNAPSNADAVIDFRRFVLFFGHDFDEHIRFYSEVEVEHAIASSEDRGEVEIEQGFLDFLVDKRVNFRGGLVLMPMGIVNVYHEPPSFNGVDRPDVDTLVIPSTWREPGVGIFGELADAVRYQLYVVNGFDANGFTAESAIAEGHQEAQLAHARDIGAIARVDYEPVLGTVLGASAYAGTSGNSLRGAVGNVPIAMFDVDARYHKKAWSARGEFAVLFVGETDKLNTALLAADPMAAVPVAARSQGGYLELGYDLMSVIDEASKHSLTVFARFDYADTQANVIGGMAALQQFRRTSEVFGLVYRPIPQVALKADFRLRQFGEGDGSNEFASAITWLF